MRVCDVLILAAVMTTVAGCSNNSGTPNSPRENAYTVGQVYAAVEVAAETATSVASLPLDVKQKIAGATQQATNGVIAYLEAARNCLRDPATGVVGNAPGKTCDTSEISRDLTAAQTALAGASSLLAQYGVVPTTGANPTFAAQ